MSLLYIKYNDKAVFDQIKSCPFILLHYQNIHLPKMIWNLNFIKTCTTCLLAHNYHECTNMEALMITVLKLKLHKQVAHENVTFI